LPGRIQTPASGKAANDQILLFASHEQPESQGAKVNNYLLSDARSQKNARLFFFEYCLNGYRPFDPAAHDGFPDSRF
jgi:hypothetical protein